MMKLLTCSFSGSKRHDDQAKHSPAEDAPAKRVVGRSRSHRPQSYYVAPVATPKASATDSRLAVHHHEAVAGEDGGKPALRKYNSFPYHVFVNCDTEYSSDDSRKSHVAAARLPRLAPGDSGGGLVLVDARPSGLVKDMKRRIALTSSDDSPSPSSSPSNEKKRG